MSGITKRREQDIVAHRDPESLEPHPKNEDIYGDEELPADFVNSIRENGVREPIVVTPDGTVISGHRRRAAAVDIGLDEVPVVEREFEDEYEEWEAIIDYNRQRRKSPAQIVREAEVAMEIEDKRARDRQAHGETAPGKNASGKISDSVESGEVRNKAAERINADVSGRTIEKGKRVKEAARSEGKADEHGLDHEEAQRQWEQLEEDEQTFHGAYKEARVDDGSEDSDFPAEYDEHECSVCGDTWFDFSGKLSEFDSETVSVDKVCVVEWPDTVVLHIPPEEVIE